MLGSLVFDATTPLSAPPFANVSHHTGLVLLSLLVAFISSSMAFYMVYTHQKTAAASHRRIALLCSSMVLGLGIWAMHFIGMLAISLPSLTRYDPWLTALSIIPGMLASWLALRWMQAPPLSHRKVLGSGLLMGAGIAVMHYSGIAALQVNGRVFFDATFFVLSALLGTGLGIAAFAAQRWVYHSPNSAPGFRARRRFIPPLLMTLAMASMHYVSMHGLRFAINTETTDMVVPTAWLQNKPMLSTVIAVMTCIVFLILGLANAIMRYRDLWQAVAARDARLHAMVETAPEGVVTINAQGLVQDFNPQAQHIFGYRKEEVVGRNIAMLMPSPLAEQHDTYLAQHQHHPERPLAINGREVLGKHKDGRHIPLQLSIGKALMPSGTLFVGYLKDISAHKRADAQLRIAASVFQNVREGVAIVDANHNISDVNPAFLRLMDKSREQCLGKSLEWLYEDADADTLPDMHQLWRTVATQHYWQGEILCTHGQEARWAHRLSVSPVLNEQQRPQHFIAVISAIARDSVTPL